MVCRYCLDDTNEKTIYPCACKGGGVHPTCLEHWIRVSHKSTCEICLTDWDRKIMVAFVFRRLIVDIFFVIGLLFVEVCTMTGWFVCVYYFTISVMSFFVWFLFWICLSFGNVMYSNKNQRFLRMSIYVTFTLLNLFNRIGYVYDCSQSSDCPLQRVHINMLYQWLLIILLMLVSLFYFWKQV